MVVVELDSDHRFVALAVEVVVIFALHLIILIRMDRALQVVAEVGVELVVSLREMNCESLIVNDCPSAFLAGPHAIWCVQNLNSEVSLKEHIQRLYYSWQRELQGFVYDLKSIKFII